MSGTFSTLARRWKMALKEMAPIALRPRRAWLVAIVALTLLAAAGCGGHRRDFATSRLHVAHDRIWPPAPIAARVPDRARSSPSRPPVPARLPHPEPCRPNRPSTSRRAPPNRRSRRSAPPAAQPARRSETHLPEPAPKAVDRRRARSRHDPLAIGPDRAALKSRHSPHQRTSRRCRARARRPHRP